MSERIEALPWDSDFFGLSIGKVALDGATDADLDAIDREARDRDFDCVYGRLDATADRTNVGVRAQRHGHLLAEVAILMSRPDRPYAGIATESVARIATEDDIDAVHAVLCDIAPWSRYGADPNFGVEAAEKMFRAWVERAIRDDDRMIAVAEDEDGFTGVSTNVMVGPTGDPCVDFMVVTKPGKGVSGALLQAYVDWAPAGPLDAGPCAARNLAVLRFLERYDFTMSQSHYLFHWWKEGARYGG